MKRPLQNTLVGFVISLILSPLVVSAELPKTATSEVKYYHYYYEDPIGYHRLLPSLATEERRYHTRLVAEANINDTPEKEKVVLIVVDTKQHTPYGEWLQAFLLITDSDINNPKKKDLLKLFDSDSYDLEVPAAKSIELHEPPFVFKERLNDAPWKPHGVSFRLIDLTGDGILDVWVKFGYAVVVISFQDGEFREIFSAYTVPGSLPDPAYVDLDNDGTYEIKIPYSIRIEGIPGAPYLPWVSLYEWDGNTYVLNNERFYAENNEFLIRLLSEYNYQMLRRGSFTRQREIYSFYLGLVFHYRGNAAMAGRYLKSVTNLGTQDDYIQAAESLLKKLPPH